MVDTSGWAFMYPLFRLAGVKVASYTHYPTISTDMLQRVISRQAAFNNDAGVAGSPLKSLVKVVYYYLFAAAYGAVGGCTNVSMQAVHSLHMHCTKLRQLCVLMGAHTSQVVMVNSSWTREHISKLWWKFTQPSLVYPPCNVSQLAALKLDRKLKSLYLVSLAQFRPEKDQAKQLRAFALARQRAAALERQREAAISQGTAVVVVSPFFEAVLAARLKVVGSCRNAEDEERVVQLVGLVPLCQYLMSALNQRCHPCTALLSLAGWRFISGICCVHRRR